MIAYFVYNLDNYSGAAQQALLLAKNMKRNILFFNHNNKTYKKYQYNHLIEIVDLPQNKFLQLFFILFFTIKYKIKIYHFHGTFNVGMLLGLILKKKIILKTTLLGDDDFDTLASKRSWNIRCFFIKHIHKNIVLSKKLKEINSKYIDSSKIEIIPNGISLPQNCPILKDKEEAFCFVGLVCPRKRTFESIKYFIENYSKNEISKMYVVGPHKNMQNNHEFSNDYVNSCFELVKNNKLENRIIFTDRVSKEETLSIFKKCKALLFFSDKEGLPNVVLEAMSQNCVPITTGIDGVVEEILDNRVHGFIINESYPPIDIVLIDNIIKSNKPYLNVENRFSINKIADSYINIY